MKKELWDTVKPFLLKSFLLLVGLPFFGVVIGVIIFLSLGDKNPLSKIGIAIATIGLISCAIGFWNFAKIVVPSLALKKKEAIIVKSLLVAVFIGAGFLIDYIMGGGK
jgi:hypothetical protein